MLLVPPHLWLGHKYLEAVDAFVPFDISGTIETAAEEPAVASSRSLFYRPEKYQKASQNCMPLSIASSRFEKYAQVALDNLLWEAVDTTEKFVFCVTLLTNVTPLLAFASG